MIDAIVGYLLFTAESAQHQTESSHIKQVTGDAVILAPLVHLIYRHESTFTDHVAKMTFRIACQTDKINARELLLIVLGGTLIVLCTKTLLLVFGIVVHAVFHRLQRFAFVGSRQVIYGQVGGQCHTVSDGVVDVY